MDLILIFEKILFFFYQTMMSDYRWQTEAKIRNTHKVKLIQKSVSIKYSATLGSISRYLSFIMNLCQPQWTSVVMLNSWFWHKGEPSNASFDVVETLIKSLIHITPHNRWQIFTINYWWEPREGLNPSSNVFKVLITNLGLAPSKLE